MNETWPEVAKRLVTGVGVKPGELVQVRDRSGRREVLEEILLAVEFAGATPLPELLPPEYTRRLLNSATAEYLNLWDRQRQPWVRQTDRILVLQGEQMDESGLPNENLRAWKAATHRLTATEEQIGPLPFLLAAIPTEDRALRYGMSLAALEEKVMPAVLAEPAELQARVSRILEKTNTSSTMTMRSGAGGKHELRLALGNRPWITDDGRIDEEDRSRGGVVSNLPAGSVYTTVLEEQTEGELFLPEAGYATAVLMHFERGRVVEIRAESGAEALESFFDAHSGEPRRIGHLGIGLNPRLREPLGWTLVDVHAAGHVFVSFGENRYMGGHNESSLNVDFALPGATVEVSDRKLLELGQITL